MKRIFLILVAACVLRIGAAWLLKAQLTYDRDAYLAIAHNLADNRVYSSVPGGEPTAYRPPLYPVVLAPVLRLTGQAAAVALVNLAAGVLTVWLTYATGRRLGLQRGALVASGAVAVDPLLIQYSAQPMTEVVSAALVVGFVWAVVDTNRGARIEIRGSRVGWRPAFVGALFGAAALCRPTMWLAGGLLAMWWLIPTRIERRGGGGRGDAGTAWWRLASCTLGIVLVVAPWVVRNWAVFGRPIVTTTHGGYTLLLANNPVFYREVVGQPWGTIWDGRSLARWNAAVEVELQRENPPIRGEVARDGWMYDRAWEHIFEQPEMFLQACWLRFRRFWNVAPLDTSATMIEDAWRGLCRTLHWPAGAGAAAGVATAVRWLVAVFYIAVTAAFLVGLVRLRREWRRWLPVFLVVVAFTAAHLVYWTNTRMRAPVVPLIALMAARGVAKRIE